MAKVSGVLTGTAGVYYVASQLAARGFHAAITHGNAPSVDIFVGLLDGASTVSLQVKTSSQALRTRGRGPKKVPYQYDWVIGERAARLNHPDLFFVFVNLKGGEFVNTELAKQALPEVFIVPSGAVHSAFNHYTNRYWNWTPGVEEVEPYKNNWELLRNHLAGKVSQ
ncbi:MAG: hypothetical protein Q7K03_00495 [Dehalococcoidia bacterium]|nr:hypothetical protein [Dehalococcoidia bacterium]